MADILMVIEDKCSTMTPQTDKGRGVLPQEKRFEGRGSAFFLSLHLARFKKQDVTVEIQDNRTSYSFSSTQIWYGNLPWQGSWEPAVVRELMALGTSGYWDGFEFVLMMGWHIDGLDARTIAQKVLEHRNKSVRRGAT